MVYLSLFCLLDFDNVISAMLVCSDNQVAGRTNLRSPAYVHGSYHTHVPGKTVSVTHLVPKCSKKSRCMQCLSCSKGMEMHLDKACEALLGTI